MRESGAEVCADVPQLHCWAGHEADRGVEVSSNPFVRDSDIDEIVWIVDLEAARRRVAAQVFAAGAETPDTDEEIVVASEMRRRVGEIHSAQPAARSTERI